MELGLFAACMHAILNLRVLINVRGSCLICENHEHLYPQKNIPAIGYTVETGLLAHALMGSIAELYALIFENVLIIQ